VVHQVSETVNIPVLGSGDVVDEASARERMRGKIRGLLIGRGALSNPMVFDEIVNGRPTDLRRRPDLVLDIMERYCALLQEEFLPAGCVGKVKQLASQMCRGYTWRKELCMAMTLPEQLEILRRARQSPGREQAPGLEQVIIPSRDELEAGSGLEIGSP
jgi:tRNA-dihydrouridine synthase